MDSLSIANPVSEAAEKISASLWFFFIVALLSNILGGNISTLMAVYLPVVVHDLLGNNNNDYINNVSAYINSVYLIGWTLGGFLWGMFSDRIGRVKSFLVSFVLFGLFTLLIGFVSSWEIVVALRFLSGFCVGGLMVVSNIYMTEIWPERTRAIFIGFLSIGFPIGIFSAGMVSYLFESWRAGFMIGFIPATIAALSAIILWNTRNKSHPDLIVQTGSNFKAVFNDNHKNLIKGSIIFGSMLIGMWAVFSWLPTWIQSLLQNSDGSKERGIGMMLMGMGGLTGGFVSGWVARIFGLRKSLILCFAGCILLSLIMFGFNRSFSNIIYLEIAVITVFFGISQGLLGTFIPQMFASSIRGTATGFCYNTGRVVTALAVFFVGTMVSIFGGYSNTLLAFSIIFVIGLITIYFAKDIKLKTN
jgi:MFS family permease